MKIKTRLVLLTAILTVALLGIVGASTLLLYRLSDSIRSERALTGAVRAYMQMDMMHDALRGDVMSRLLAADEKERQAAVASTEEHATEMTEMLDTLGRFDIASVRRDFPELRPSLAQYVQTARALVGEADLAKARAMMPAFTAAFEDLEERNEKLGDKLVQSNQNALDRFARRGAGWLIAVGLAMIAVLLYTSFKLFRRVSRSLHDTTDVLGRVANGDLTCRATSTGSDEFGTMAESLNTTLASLEGAFARLAGNTMLVARSAEDLNAVAISMTSSATDSSRLVGVAATAATQVSSSVGGVSSSCAAMEQTIRSIASSAHDAAKVATQAVASAEETNRTVARLASSSAEIDQVVKLITSIAERTNLLALNATIEAARAGEAGRGFSIVASEVKDLARQTANATEEIGHKIAAIQTDTESAISAIGQVSSVIDKIHRLQQSIAEAVEAQSQATMTIGRDVQDATRAAGDIGRHLSGTSEAAVSTTRGADKTRDAAQQLATLAVELRQMVSRFDFHDGAAPRTAMPATIFPRQDRGEVYFSARNA